MVNKYNLIERRCRQTDPQSTDFNALDADELMASNGKPCVRVRTSHLDNSPFYKLKRQLTDGGPRHSTQCAVANKCD